MSFPGTASPLPDEPEPTGPHAVPRLRPTVATRGQRNPEFAFDVAIVGLGYVGLPTALAYHQAGDRVLGVDVSARRLATVEAGDPDLTDADLARLDRARIDSNFVLTSDPKRLAEARAVIVCVPTPVDSHLIPDLSLLRAACAAVVEVARPGQLVMLTSTTYVGCTHDMLSEPLAERGFTIGEDMFVAFSAERIDPGKNAMPQEEVTRVMGAGTQECEKRAEELLRSYAGAVHTVHSLAAAEMTKLLENTFRAVNIALANEFADICKVFDVSVTDVIDAAATKPYGFMPFYPGPGVGGHCIPCDPHYLLWQLREKRVDARLISSAMTDIAARPAQVVDRISTMLADAGLSNAQARVLVVGVAYKADVADLRESPALEILAGLRERGVSVGFLDDHVSEVRLPTGEILTSSEDPRYFGADLVLIHTRHSTLDLGWMPTDQLVLDATYRSIDLPQRMFL